jgi:4-hydroxybutyrate dehydrogenase
MALIQYLTQIHFDAGAVRLLPDELRRLRILKPFLVTDRGLVATGMVRRITELCGDFSPARIFDTTPENPTAAAVRQAAERYREAGCDGIIAFGGGSPIDLAKGVALMATQAGPIEQFAAAAGGMERITPAVAPVIAIPTTAGSGSEVGRATVLVMDDGRKMAVVSPHLFPKLALCDPELTHTLPPRLTAGTGMDAIAHCIETFLSPALNPPAEAIALDGLARGVAHLPRACASGADLEARSEMMMAALEGGLAFQKGLGAVHAMSHPLGALREVTVHHGTANAILLPAVLRFNEPAAGAKFERLRATLGLTADADLAAFFHNFVVRIGLPATLRAVGVPRERLPALAAMATQDFSARTNPRPASAADYERLYAESYG